MPYFPANCLKYIFKLILEGGREKEREMEALREKHEAHYLSMCPDQISNRQPPDARDDVQPMKPQQLGTSS